MEEGASAHSEVSGAAAVADGAGDSETVALAHVDGEKRFRSLTLPTGLVR
jgi:hypothetical protein